MICYRPASTHPLCEDAIAYCLRSSTASLPTHFPLYHIHQLAHAFSDCVAKEGEIAVYNKSENLSGGVKLLLNTFICSVFSPTDS